MDKLRVGVVGLRRGRQFVEVFQRHPDCRVVAVCDPNPKALAPYADLAACADYDEFLDRRLDIVAVISPGPFHAEQSVRAMRRGAHVLCETPCAYSVDEARDILAASRLSGRRFMLAEDFVWSGWMQALRARRDALGAIVYAEGDYTHDCRDVMLADEDGFVPYADRAARPGAKKTWRATDLPPIVYCSHTLGPLLELTGDRVVSVVGMASSISAAPELGTTPLESALLTTAGGAVIRLTNGFTVSYPMTFFYNLVGTRGAARVDNLDGFGARWYSDSDRAAGWRKLPADQIARADGRDQVTAMVGDFVDAVVRGAPSPLEAVRSMEMVLPGVLAHGSARRGGVRLDVPDLRGE